MKNVEQINISNKNTKEKGFEIISLKSFFKTIDTTFIKKQFRTEFYNMVVVTEGKCVHEIDFLDYTIKPGELLFISKNRTHRYSEFDDLEGYLIMFTEGFLCEFLSSHTTEVKDLFKQSYMNPHVELTDSSASTLRKLLDVIYDIHSNDDDMNNQVTASALRTAALLILKSNLSEDSLNEKRNEIFMQFTELLEEYIDTEKTVEGYADMMHVSKKTINLVTRKAVDMSAKQYIIHQLILKIKLKLCFEQKGISEIAYELGFTEASNMTKFFKKYTRINPREFRNMNRGKNWIENDGANVSLRKESIETNIYHVLAETVVPLHQHKECDEIFYCIKGSGYGVLEDGEVELTAGSVFVVPARQMHSLRSEGSLYVTSFMIPTENK